MVVTCPVCRDVVHVYAGYYVVHGVRIHGVFETCIGSSTPVGTICDSCA